MRTIAIAAFSAAVVCAAPAFAQAMTPAAYVAKAGASDLYERESSQLLLQTSKNPKLREFATMMIRDHAKSTADVKAAAARSGVKAAPPKLDTMQAKNIATLRADSGVARDAAYISQQRVAHDQALALQQGYAADGTAPVLKSAAASIVPVVQHHIEMLNSM